MTKIEWVQNNGVQGKTWNPIVGCSKVSAGCQNCYAINQAYRNAAMGQKLESPGRLAYYEGLTEKRGWGVEWTGKIAFVPEALEIPLKTRKPTTWFVNSMSDLFHESVTDEQLDQIFAVMALTPQHTYQVLTKRPERMVDYMGEGIGHRQLAEACRCSDVLLDAIDNTEAPLLPKGIGIPPNVWLGVTVENQQAADERIPLLLQTPAAVRFLSCEPLLDGLDLSEYLAGVDYAPDSTGHQETSPGIDWAIVGGESGHGARPCNLNWIRSIVEQCAAAEVPCFVKQIGQRNNWTMNKMGASWKGNNPDEWPADLRVRQMPAAFATV